MTLPFVHNKIHNQSLWQPENKILWLFTDFNEEFSISLTWCKISWLFPDLEKTRFFPDRGNPALSEDLTKYNLELLKTARQQDAIHSVWSRDGKIFVKRSIDGRKEKISRLRDIIWEGLAF